MGVHVSPIRNPPSSQCIVSETQGLIRFVTLSTVLIIQVNGGPAFQNAYRPSFEKRGHLSRSPDGFTPVMEPHHNVLVFLH